MTADAVRFDQLHRAYRGGAVTALYDALALALEHGTVPRWVLDAARQRIAVSCAWPTGRGRTANPRARALSDYIHFYRWDLVLAIRRHQAQYDENLQGLRQLKIPRSKIAAIMAGHRDFGHTWADAYQHASRELANHFAFGSADTIKKSYLRVQRNTAPGRYLLPSRLAVSALLQVTPD
ncbi:MAG TPA: hypothetical protein VNJ04_07160 [Gemmatimonadaceae bacterium]|nr:hypothetical protein [Gemmatimonadaceae bacterium]